MTSDLILSIESSCDETSAAVVDSGLGVRSLVTASQIELHNEYGGVYPEMASRQHVANIIPVVHQAMLDAGVDHSELRAVAVTRGPGLMSSLAVGVNTARALGRGWGVPVMGINHLRGHVSSAELDGFDIDFPAVLLLVSGGHTLLAVMEDSARFRLLGETRDDSVGEAYDKVARELGLGYPGGPVVDRLAKSGVAQGRLPRVMATADYGYDFSLSGLKEATRQLIRTQPELSVEDVCAEFVDACLGLLVRRVKAAVTAESPRSVVVVGGVSASPPLRARMQEVCDGEGIRLLLPDLRWATDNAAMIGGAAWRYLGVDAPVEVGVEPRLRFDEF
jgi:N6-L-threonylcarbamoyladenine synthase